MSYTGSVIATSSVVEQIGNNATLQCTFTGYLPVNYEITWRLDGGPSLDDDMYGKYIISEDFNGMGQSQNGGDTIDNGVISELTVISLTDSDIGRYTCHMNGSNLTATIQLISKYTLSIVVILSNSLYKFIMCYFIVSISTAVSIGLTSSINVSVIPPSTSTDNTISVIIGITVTVIVVVIIIATVSIVAMVTVVIVVVRNVKRQTSTEIPDHSINVLDNAAYGISNTAVNEVVYEDIPQFDYEKPYDL